MSPKKYYTFMIEPGMAAALKAIKEADGISESEQIRRGIQLWLQSREVTSKKTPPKRVAVRKRG